MGWLNSDDILVPGSLFVIAEVFSHLMEVDWLTGVALTIDAKNRYVKVHKYKKNIFDFLVGDWEVIQQESTFWRRSLWQLAGGRLNESFTPSYDAELWCRFFLHADHYHLDTVLGGYRKVAESTSVRKIDEYRAQTQSALEILSKSAPKDIASKTRQYRRYRSILNQVGSQKISRLVYVTLGRPGFRHKSISYRTLANRWHTYEEY